MTRLRVLLSEPFATEAVEWLRASPSVEVVYEPALSRPELLALLPTIDALVVRSRTLVDRELLESSARLRMVGLAATALANVDFETAGRKGVNVVHCAGMTANAVAELTLALMLSAFRQVAWAHAHMQTGGWDRERFLGEELRGKVLGVVGMGATGSRVIELALAFGMKVCAYDHRVSPEKTWRFVRYFPTIDEMAPHVNVLTLHVPLTTQTTQLISRTTLQKLPPGAVLVNTARGELVDEGALLEALNTGHLGAAALDTWCHEPSPVRALVTHPKVVALPHIGGSTVQAQLAMLSRVRAELERLYGCDSSLERNRA